MTISMNGAVPKTSGPQNDPAVTDLPWAPPGWKPQGFNQQEMMPVALKNDSTDLSDKQPNYYERNIQWVKPGEHVYSTVLEPPVEQAFKNWIAVNKIPFDTVAPVTDYDMRGFYSALQAKDPRAVAAVNPNDNQMHYPDYWKTPYHETFSRDSQWAAANAPIWSNGKLITPQGFILFDEKEKALQDRLRVVSGKAQEQKTAIKTARGTDL